MSDINFNIARVIFLLSKHLLEHSTCIQTLSLFAAPPPQQAPYQQPVPYQPPAAYQPPPQAAPYQPPPLAAPYQPPPQVAPYQPPPQQTYPPPTYTPYP